MAAKTKAKTKGSKLLTKSTVSWNQASVMAFVALFVSVGVFVVMKSNASSGCVNQTFSTGSAGNCVTYIQQLTNWQLQYGSWSNGGRYSLLTVDGTFDAMTKTNVKIFQGTAGLKQDGIVNQDTWSKLCSANMGYVTSSGTNRVSFPASFPKTAAVAAGCYPQSAL